VPVHDLQYLFKVRRLESNVLRRRPAEDFGNLRVGIARGSKRSLGSLGALSLNLISPQFRHMRNC
jgi:hypothetical protein